MVTHGNVTTYLTELSNEAVRGHDANQSWNNIPGVGAFGGRKETVIAMEKTPDGSWRIGTNHSSANLVVHEFSHSIDRLLNKLTGGINPSDDADFWNRWLSIFDQLDPYYQQSGQRGSYAPAREETFAEGMAHRYDKEGDAARELGERGSITDLSNTHNRASVWEALASPLEKIVARMTQDEELEDMSFSEIATSAPPPPPMSLSETAAETTPENALTSLEQAYLRQHQAFITATINSQLAPLRALGNALGSALSPEHDMSPQQAQERLTRLCETKHDLISSADIIELLKQAFNSTAAELPKQKETCQWLLLVTLEYLIQQIQTPEAAQQIITLLQRAPKAFYQDGAVREALESLLTTLQNVNNLHAETTHAIEQMTQAQLNKAQATEAFAPPYSAQEIRQEITQFYKHTFKALRDPAFNALPEHVSAPSAYQRALHGLQTDNAHEALIEAKVEQIKQQIADQLASLDTFSTTLSALINTNTNEQESAAQQALGSLDRERVSSFVPYPLMFERLNKIVNMNGELKTALPQLACDSQICLIQMLEYQMQQLHSPEGAEQITALLRAPDRKIYPDLRINLSDVLPISDARAYPGYYRKFLTAPLGVQQAFGSLLACLKQYAEGDTRARIDKMEVALNARGVETDSLPLPDAPALAKQIRQVYLDASAALQERARPHFEQQIAALQTLQKQAIAELSTASDPLETERIQREDQEQALYQIKEAEVDATIAHLNQYVDQQIEHLTAIAKKIKAGNALPMLNDWYKVLLKSPLLSRSSIFLSLQPHPEALNTVCSQLDAQLLNLLTLAVPTPNGPIKRRSNAEKTAARVCDLVFSSDPKSIDDEQFCYLLSNLADKLRPYFCGSEEHYSYQDRLLDLVNYMDQHAMRVVPELASADAPAMEKFLAEQFNDSCDKVVQSLKQTAQDCQRDLHADEARVQIKQTLQLDALASRQAQRMQDLAHICQTFDLKPVEVFTPLIQIQHIQLAQTWHDIFQHCEQTLAKEAAIAAEAARQQASEDVQQIQAEIAALKQRRAAPKLDRQEKGEISQKLGKLERELKTMHKQRATLEADIKTRQADQIERQRLVIREVIRQHMAALLQQHGLRADAQADHDAIKACTDAIDHLGLFRVYDEVEHWDSGASKVDIQASLEALEKHIAPKLDEVFDPIEQDTAACLERWQALRGEFDEDERQAVTRYLAAQGVSEEHMQNALQNWQALAQQAYQTGADELSDRYKRMRTHIIELAKIDHQYHLERQEHTAEAKLSPAHEARLERERLEEKVKEQKRDAFITGIINDWAAGIALKQAEKDASNRAIALAEDEAKMAESQQEREREGVALFDGFLFAADLTGTVAEGVRERAAARTIRTRLLDLRTSVGYGLALGLSAPEIKETEQETWEREEREAMYAGTVLTTRAEQGRDFEEKMLALDQELESANDTLLAIRHEQLRLDRVALAAKAEQRAIVEALKYERLSAELDERLDNYGAGFDEKTARALLPDFYSTEVKVSAPPTQQAEYFVDGGGTRFA